TAAGIPAIEACIAEGININVTLIFSVENYKQVAEAYINGLEKRYAAGESIAGIASVASFFLGRIDVMVDNILTNNIRAAQIHNDIKRITANRELLGQSAIASARLAYQEYRAIFEGSRFSTLKSAGAQVQRPLWASTGTKDAVYSDTRYVDMLIGRNTVNTLPPKTLDAFLEHGTVSDTLAQKKLPDFADPQTVMYKLSERDIDITDVTARLQFDGVEAFIEAYETLLEQVDAKRNVLQTGIIARQLLALGIYNQDVQRILRKLDTNFVNPRIHDKDGSLWSEFGPKIASIKQRLGWLNVLDTIDYERLDLLQSEIKASDFTHILIMGMGGSSLAPEVIYKSFGQQPDFPEIIVLDSPDPVRIRVVESTIDMAKTLFIVASKSGTTIETMSFYRYFWQQAGKNGAQFIAITDEGSLLQQLAETENFRHIFLNPSDVGGRFSALSYFGLVPAALMGLDLSRIRENITQMMAACGEDIPAKNHPGLSLGAVIGAIAAQGRDKLCIFGTASIASFSDWAETLIAESLGKNGKGILPVVRATIGNPHDYATDRLFVYLRVDDDTDMEAMDAGVRTLREAGHPRFTQRIADVYGIFGEFYRWQFATAVAGRLIGINPFDEPDVASAIAMTDDLLNQYEADGSLPDDTPFMSGERIQFFADENTLAPLRELCRAHSYNPESRTEVLAAQIAGTHAGDYFTVLAYLTPDETRNKLLETIRRRLRHVTKRAVTIGSGPRYLHSTGQFHKGGPNNGIFMVLTTDIDEDIDIPGVPYTFGQLMWVQAMGDFKTLQANKRRVIRIHIEGDIKAGLDKVLDAIEFVGERRT
ncbi:MAG: bifunctional transaldolase/phosoglucose isomerase, partial [Aggregatilineales bacterium]